MVVRSVAESSEYRHSLALKLFIAVDKARALLTMGE